MISAKPYAESCDQNREPILQVLETYADSASTVLEISSGTGQHAVYFSEQLPWLSWQTSDLKSSHPGIQAWIDDSANHRIMPPIELDVSQQKHWPGRRFDIVFTANSMHILSSQQVSDFFRHCPKVMHENSILMMYGPFNYDGQYTSDSNARFDQWLKSQNSLSCIKDFEWLQQLASQSGLLCHSDHEMPANNRMLVWKLDLKSELNWHPPD